MAALFMTEFLAITSAHAVNERVGAPQDDDIVSLGEIKPSDGFALHDLVSGDHFGACR
jgi:hypothetical protein